MHAGTESEVLMLSSAPAGLSCAAAMGLACDIDGKKTSTPLQAPRYIQGSFPYAPEATLGSVPCACVLVSPLHINRLRKHK